MEKRLQDQARLDELLIQAKAGNVRTSGGWLSELISLAPWQISLSPHVLLHYYCDYGENEMFRDALLADTERLCSEVADFLPPEPQPRAIPPPDEPGLECFILHTHSPRTFGSVDESGQFFYLLDPEQDPEYVSKLRHETVHVLWGRRHGEAPPLFTEGIAVYGEHLSVPHADAGVLLSDADSVLEDTPCLAAIADTEEFWKCGGFYRAGGLFVWYLVSRWGWKSLAQLFDISCYQDPSILEHFREVYQMDLSTVDSEWRQHLSSL
jgi:hypothetical protein